MIVKKYGIFLMENESFLKHYAIAEIVNPKVLIFTVATNSNYRLKFILGRKVWTV